MPMEGLVKTISDKKNISFGAVRVCLEVLFTVCSAISSFAVSYTHLTSGLCLNAALKEVT